MATGNQTLLLSGSLLSNAATELAQTLRSDLLQLLDKSVMNLTRYGLSDMCVSNLQSAGFVLVTDLNFLQVGQLRMMGFPEKELPLLSEICNEVRRTISVGSLSKILRNASENITQIAANLPIKNTFIDFPSLFPSAPVVNAPPQPQSCPAFFWDNEIILKENINPKKNNICISRTPSDDAVIESISTIPGGRPGRPSRGASEHGTGNCKPCAWYHHTEGCRHEVNCEFCHMCPEGEIKKRKKDKQKLLKSIKVTQDADSPSVPSFSTTGACGKPNSNGLSNWIGSIFAK